ncbi:MAG: spondin domain-containing protein [Microcoleaceae cyanobacterium]
MTTQQVTISIENLAPENGTFITPVWFGFHDGTFDTYDRGRPVSPGLESVAEDGDTSLISTEFDLAGFGTVQGTIPGGAGIPGVIDPGETTTFTVELDLDDPQSAFFNYASMIVPSNDFFIANGNERAFQIVDEEGNFLGTDFVVLGENILDAGTEVNDEIPANTAFFGQQTPDTGVDENGVVEIAEGFIPGGNILSSDDFFNADFTAEGYEVARIRVFIEDEVAEPTVLSSVLTGDQEVAGGADDSVLGFSSFSLNEAGDALEYELTFSGLDFGALLGTDPLTPDTGDDVTRIHIHDGDRGENGPVAFGLFDLVAPEADGQDADDLTVVDNGDGSVTLSGIWEETDPALIALSEFVDEIQDAEFGEDIGLYWNVHTNEFPGGAIRGQLQGGDLSGEDEIVGGEESDSIGGGAGDDLVAGGLGDDLISGSIGDDILRGDANVRSSDEAGGNDTLLGGAGNDRIGGKAGDDELFGQAGNDRLFGDQGDDLLNGGLGNDQLFGGEGGDQFVLAAGNDRDSIRDFEVGIDTIVLDGLTVDQLELEQQANGVRVTLIETDEVLAVVRDLEVDDLSDSFI